MRTRTRTTAITNQTALIRTCMVPLKTESKAYDMGKPVLVPTRSIIFEDHPLIITVVFIVYHSSCPLSYLSSAHGIACIWPVSATFYQHCKDLLWVDLHCLPPCLQFLGFVPVSFIRTQPNS
jgi:hypothetical protein